MPTIREMLGHPPNFLIFVVDNLGDTLGIYGHRDVHVPWWDVLGYQGMRFTSLAPTPTCRQALAPLPGLLARQNYARIAIGKPIGPADDYESCLADGAPVEQIYEIADTTLARLACHPERPFLVTVSAREANRTLDALRQTAYDEELAAALTLPEHLEETPDNRRALAAWYGQLQLIDHYLARLMDEVDDRGLDEDTLVILTSDGPSPFAEESRSPALILRWSSILPGSWTGDQPITYHDLLSTLVDLAELPTADLPGTSLLPILENP